MSSFLEAKRKQNKAIGKWVQQMRRIKNALQQLTLKSHPMIKNNKFSRNWEERKPLKLSTLSLMSFQLDYMKSFIDKSSKELNKKIQTN